MRATKGFGIFVGKGFHMTFPNGHTVSVQFGPTNYCEHSKLSSMDWYKPAEVAKSGGTWQSHNAEVASWGPDGKWTTKGFFKDHGDDVVGHLTPEEVLPFINWVAAQPAK